MRNTLRILSLTLCLGLGVIASAAAAGELEQDYREAVKAAQGGQMDKAIEIFTRLIGSGADGNTKALSDLYNMRGVCHEAKSELQDALADYSKAIEIDPKSANALGNRAFLYDKLGDKFKAKEDAVAAKRIDRKVKVPAFD